MDVDSQGMRCMAVDLKALDRNDLGAVITGALAVLVSFIGAFVTIETHPPLPPTIKDNGYTAWDGIGPLAGLLLVLGLVIVALRIFAPDMLTPKLPWHHFAAGLAAAATLIWLVKGLTFGVDGPKGVTEHVDAGVGWSGWLLFGLGIAFTVFAYLGSGSTSFPEAQDARAQSEEGSGRDSSAAEDTVGVDVDEQRDRRGDEHADEAGHDTSGGGQPGQEL
jgi:hypothetical protein